LSYAGDITCQQCWSALVSRPAAQLIDVRTSYEWTEIGTPDLSGLSQDLLRIEWKRYPSMQVNENFVTEAVGLLSNVNAGKNTPIFMLCRSGVRSLDAARALTAAGYDQVFNVLSGFEGPPNQKGEGGSVAGWKFDGLPWEQN